jgi:hypothetical protein
MMANDGFETACAEKRALALNAQPTQLRRCLSCEQWMRSTGCDHRICNACKGNYSMDRGPGSKVQAC